MIATLVVLAGLARPAWAQPAASTPTAPAASPLQAGAETDDEFAAWLAERADELRLDPPFAQLLLRSNRPLAYKLTVLSQEILDQDTRLRRFHRILKREVERHGRLNVLDVRLAEAVKTFLSDKTATVERFLLLTDKLGIRPQPPAIEKVATSVRPARPSTGGSWLDPDSGQWQRYNSWFDPVTRGWVWYDPDAKEWRPAEAPAPLE